MPDFFHVMTGRWVTCYKTKGRWFGSRWGHCNFSIDLILPAALCPCSWLSLYQKLVPGISLCWERVKSGRRIRLTTSLPSVSRLQCGSRLTTLWAFMACSRDSFTFFWMTRTACPMPNILTPEVQLNNAENWIPISWKTHASIWKT
jgi:hypothetical protein